MSGLTGMSIRFVLTLGRHYLVVSMSQAPGMKWR